MSEILARFKLHGQKILFGILDSFWPHLMLVGLKNRLAFRFLRFYTENFPLKNIAIPYFGNAFAKCLY